MRWIDRPTSEGWWLFRYSWWKESSTECVLVYLGESEDSKSVMYVSRVPAEHSDCLVDDLPEGAKWMKIEIPKQEVQP